MKNFLLLTILFSFISCGEILNAEKKKSPDNEIEGQILPQRVGDELNSPEVIESEAAEIGKNICESLSTKMDELSVRNGSIGANYSLEYLNCAGARSTQDFFANMQYRNSRATISARGNFGQLEEVLSADHVALEGVCRSLRNGGGPLNVVSVGSFNYRISFFEKDGYSQVGIGKYQKDENGKFRARIVDVYAVHTEAYGGNRSYIGIVRKRTELRACSSKFLRYSGKAQLLQKLQD